MKKIEDLNRLLIVVDMINGFVKEGNMADTYISHITPEILKVLDTFKETELSGVAFIKDCHEKGCQEFQLFPEHCLKGTSESMLIDELLPYEESSLSYEKNSTSAIFAPNFMNDIGAMKNLREIVVSGCCTDICVMNLVIPLVNYFNEINRDVNVIVPENMVETFNSPIHNREEWNNLAFNFMNQAGATVVKQYRLER